MVQQTLQLFEPDSQPQRLIGDKAYDCDALDETLAELGIEMIAPHRKNRLPENRTQDGRAVRRYRHRWIVERTIAWLRKSSSPPRAMGKEAIGLHGLYSARLSYDRHAQLTLTRSVHSHRKLLFGQPLGKRRGETVRPGR